MSKEKSCHARHSSFFEPNIFPDNYEEIIRLESIQRELDEQRRYRKLKEKVEKAICKLFTGNELKQIQPYKEVIFEYIQSNGIDELTYSTPESQDKLNIFIKIYYKILTNKFVSLDEYAILQALHKNLDNDISSILRGKYSNSETILEFMAIDLGISEFDIKSFIDGHSSDEFVSLLSVRIASKYGNDPTKINEIKNAIITIKTLRSNPQLMGLSHEEMLRKFDKILIKKKIFK